MKTFRDFHPTVGLPDDMTVMLPPSGTRAPCQLPGVSQPRWCPSWGGVGRPQPLLPTAPSFPPQTIMKRFMQPGRESLSVGGLCGAQGTPGSRCRKAWAVPASSASRGLSSFPQMCALLGARRPPEASGDPPQPSQVGGRQDDSPALFSGACVGRPWPPLCLLGTLPPTPHTPHPAAWPSTHDSGLSLHVTSSRKPSLIS